MSCLRGLSGDLVSISILALLHLGTSTTMLYTPSPDKGDENGIFMILGIPTILIRLIFVHYDY